MFQKEVVIALSLEYKHMSSVEGGRRRSARLKDKAEEATDVMVSHVGQVSKSEKLSGRKRSRKKMKLEDCNLKSSRMNEVTNAFWETQGEFAEHEAQVEFAEHEAPSQTVKYGRAEDMPNFRIGHAQLMSMSQNPPVLALQNTVAPRSSFRLPAPRLLNTVAGRPALRTQVPQLFAPGPSRINNIPTSHISVNNTTRIGSFSSSAPGSTASNSARAGGCNFPAHRTMDSNSTGAGVFNLPAQSTIGSNSTSGTGLNSRNVGDINFSAYNRTSYSYLMHLVRDYNMYASIISGTPTNIFGNVRSSANKATSMKNSMSTQSFNSCASGSSSGFGMASWQQLPPHLTVSESSSSQLGQLGMSKFPWGSNENTGLSSSRVPEALQRLVSESSSSQLGQFGMPMFLWGSYNNAGPSSSRVPKPPQPVVSEFSSRLGHLDTSKFPWENNDSAGPSSSAVPELVNGIFLTGADQASVARQPGFVGVGSHTECLLPLFPGHGEGAIFASQQSFGQVGMPGNLQFHPPQAASGTQLNKNPWGPNDFAGSKNIKSFVGEADINKIGFSETQAGNPSEYDSADFFHELLMWNQSEENQ